MNNRDATAIFTVVSHYLRRSSVRPDAELPDQSAVEEAIIHLQERAHKHLMCGLSGEKVRELLEQLREAP